jgi:ATP-dependent exoDNAse (exonuclease V) alpha subunit
VSILNREQKAAFKTIRKFIEHPVADTFVLKGYAGTGKTYLMQYLAKWLEEQEYTFSLLASTGRAATVLKGKTGFETKTVHSELYHFSKVNGGDEELPENSPMDAYGQMSLQFSLREPDDNRKIYIVDESSMLSSEPAEDANFVTFGSGYLLTDFFAAAGNNKIIFVGDPGQLPPVGQAFSPALDMEWLSTQKRTAVTVTLKKIERTKAGNDILVLASAIRKMGMQEALPRFPKLPATGMTNVKLHGSDKLLFQNYVKRLRKSGAEASLAVARSNRMVQQINRAVRRELFGELDTPLRISDVLLVTHNNYAVPFTNGDFAVVCTIGEITMQANLYFQKIRLKSIAADKEYELLVSLDILYGKEINFTREQSKALMVDFNQRMKKKKIKPNGDAYRAAMLKDVYLNCLRARYGYAVTCHKAQGGEWNHVYLFLEKSMYAMAPPELFGWWYTAITRARQELNLAQEWWVA